MTSAASHLLPWLIAARPMAHGMIALPLLLGQAMALFTTQSFDWRWLIFCLIFGLLIQAISLYLNDYADEPLDRNNQTFWLSGGSRVIPEGFLSGMQLKKAATWLAVVMIVVGFIPVFAARPWMPVFTVLALMLGWSYSLPPVQASYRGYGELHQAFSCGILLPITGFYAQAGSLVDFLWIALLPLFLVYYASNIVTALPDVTSDTQGGKQTYPVRRTFKVAAIHALLLFLAANVAVLFISSQWGAVSIVLLILVAPPLLGLVGAAASLKRAANSPEGRPAMRQFMLLTLGSQAWLLTAGTMLLFWSGLFGH